MNRNSHAIAKSGEHVRGKGIFWHEHATCNASTQTLFHLDAQESVVDEAFMSNEWMIADVKVTPRINESPLDDRRYRGKKYFATFSDRIRHRDKQVLAVNVIRRAGGDKERRATRNEEHYYIAANRRSTRASSSILPARRRASGTGYPSASKML